MEIQHEQIWLEQLEAGEECAYKTLFDKYNSLLNSFALKYVGEIETAKDIVQDVVYDLYLKKLHFKNQIALKSYLYKVVANRCIDFLKHRKVEAKYLTEQSYKENNDFFLHQILEEEIYLLLQKAIAALPGETKRVYELLFAGYDNQEVAQTLNLTVDSLKAHKKRGKKILQKELKEVICLFLILRKIYPNSLFL